MNKNLQILRKKIRIMINLKVRKRALVLFLFTEVTVRRRRLAETI